MPRVYRVASLIPVSVLIAVPGGSAVGGSTPQFVYSDPCSMHSQGNRNVSPGCVNMSPANIAWCWAHASVWEWHCQRLGRAARAALPAGPVTAHPSFPSAWKP